MARQQVVAGNLYDKENTRNPLARLLLANHTAAFHDLLSGIHPELILEVGCGDGLVFKQLGIRFPRSSYVGLDLSLDILEEARRQRGIDDLVCAAADQLPFRRHRFDLVVCVEVLEHLQDPIGAIQAAQHVAGEYLLFSVPNEPVWRIMNLLRGAYWRSAGNTPGHVQHWRPREFVAMLRSRLQVLRVRKPFPWVMALCRVEA
jgi:2-polyprenyl-3-methyl-5-hydroxy-6-metoxy-1,4-benzoquinol methylase